LAAIQFSVKTLIGGGLALWLAMRWGLEQPSWALMTAFIVAQPLSGMVLQKGVARLFGTLVGTAMSVVFMSIAAQAPWLFLLSLALWLGLTTAVSTMLRSAFSYSFVLAGYTVAIIALPALGHPLGVFDQAVARCTEISLGIICATLVSALLWPSKVEVALTEQAREASKRAIQAAQAGLVGGDTARNDLLELLSRIIAVDAQREHAWFEGHSGRQRARAIGALVQSLLMMLRLCRSVRRQWQQLDDTQAHALTPWLEDVRQALSAPDQPEVEALRRRLWEQANNPQNSNAEQFCMARMALALDNAMASRRALKEVEEGSGSTSGPISLAVHRDVVSAVLFGTRSALAFLAMACLWLATAWTAAPGGMVLTCVVCGLFASKENGAQIGMSFLRGIYLAIPVALFVGQFILPQWSSFAMLCLALGVPLFFGALGMAHPKIGGTATSFCLHFIVLISVSNHMTFSVETFFNSALAIMVGVCAAVLAFRLLVFRYPLWQRRRLLNSNRQDLVRLTSRELADAETWFGGRMADRLLQYAQLGKDPSMAERLNIDDEIHELDIGDELIHLRKCLAMSKVSMEGADRLFLTSVANVLVDPPTSARADALDSATETLLRALDRYSQSSELRLARGAALQLQHSWQRWCASQEGINGLT
jgi:uncharacterized membrane protein YccC